ncbi:hypothetical protein P7K49_025292 [Saguinus oedipus]|uniref:Uncharacterized protein n=1 Tax=Saguinus oedipus TaxID=9490 RepID=A0ABQ9UGR9_SAGOE|nr:hypothetical protein P7K49_025292 [Saguinus oedipus]
MTKETTNPQSMEENSCKCGYGPVKSLSTESVDVRIRVRSLSTRKSSRELQLHQLSHDIISLCRGLADMVFAQRLKH